MSDRRAPPKKIFSVRSRAFRGLVYQAIALGALAVLVAWLAHNTFVNMRARGIQSGFGFLVQPAGFDIGETLIPYGSLDPHWKAFLVGVLNTLRVAVIGVAVATALGIAVGVGRLSLER